jgi:hypothetical protein
MIIFHVLYDPSQTKQKADSKKFATLAASAVFVSTFSLLFASKTAILILK